MKRLQMKVDMGMIQVKWNRALTGYMHTCQDLELEKIAETREWRRDTLRWLEYQSSKWITQWRRHEKADKCAIIWECKTRRECQREVSRLTERYSINPTTATTLLTCILVSIRCFVTAPLCLFELSKYTAEHTSKVCPLHSQSSKLYWSSA